MKTGFIYRAYYSDKSYVGKTVDFYKRKKRHFNDTDNGSELVFHRALRKYGFENFTWEILEEGISEHELNEREKFWIKMYDSFHNGYNMTEGGDGSLGVKHTEETIKKLSGINNHNYKNFPAKTLAKAVEVNKGRPNPFLGKKHTKEAKQKISKANKGRFSGRKNPMYGKKRVHSEEARCKMSEAAKRYWTEK